MSDPWMYSVSPPAPPAERTNTLALVSLICGIGGLAFGTAASVVAIVLGFMARKQIARTGEGGLRMANWGIGLGFAIGIGMIVVVLVFAVLWIAVVVQAMTTIPLVPNV